ncbi:MAG: dTDP-4-dehydrorhamnose 3,5-epimerase family protein [Candidatus Nanopelagicales bacterium]
MTPEALAIVGAWRVPLQQYADDRGYFAEWFRPEVASEVLGHPWHTAQANVSQSRRGVVRGLHYALVPPGQAKWVTCMAGVITDFIVDLRVGSPSFGQHAAVELDASRGDAVLIAEGLGHAFVVHSEMALVSYLVNQPFNPSRELAVSPLDPALGLDFGGLQLVLSPKDEAAPSLAEAAAAGALPTWDQWLALGANSANSAS